MAKYNGSVELISGITPANGQDFPLVAAHAVQVDDDGTRLDEALKNVSTDIRKGKHRQVGKACLWYHNLYEFGNTDDEAAARIAQNEIVVAGGSLYAGSFSEADKERQLAIIAKARKLNPKLKIFYYITIASWRKDGNWSHILGKGGYWDAEEAAKHPGAVRIHTKWEIFQLLEYAAHVGGSKNGKKQFIETYTWVDNNGISHTEDKYIDLYEGGVSLDGCFYDDAGMETEEGRVNQGFPSVLREKYIQLVDFTHSKGLAAFPNQLSEDWYADTVSTANPNGLPSSVGADDYMLLESCHSQVGFNGRPLWRHVNGTEGVWNYYQNWYDKVGAKVVVNDYLYGTGTGEKLSDEEFYGLATYLVCDTLCSGAHYIDLNGLLTWELPDFFDKILIPETEEYDITRKNKGHYILHANGHTLEVVRGDNLTQGETVSEKTLKKIYIYFDGVRINNAFKKLSQYAYETDQRLDNLEKDVNTIQTSYKSTANIYHRMMIDDWGKELILTNFVSTTNFIKRLEDTAKNGIATVNTVDYDTNSIRLTRLNNTQINMYVEVDITNKKGHTLELGFTVKEVTNWVSWGFNAYAPAAFGWTNIKTSLNATQKSSFYGDNFYGYVRTITIPEDTEEEKWSMRICYNGSAGEVFDLANFYVVDVDEYGEDITKDWYTNLIPKLDAVTNNNNLKICYTVDKIDDYDFDIIWDKPNDFANWSGLRWTFQNGTFKAGHTYELGFDSYENNSGGANVAFRIYFPGGNKWIPKTYKIKSSIYGDDRPGYIFTIPESATGTDGYINLTNTANGCQTSTGEYYKTSIRGIYLYDVNEENIVIRGEEPSNSFLRICRVTDEKLAKDVKLLGNALYFTDSGAIFITDFNGNRTDISCPNNGIIEDLRLLPIPTAEDEGKILQVVNGKWVVVENNPAVDPVPDNVVLFEESDEEDSVIDVESLIKNNLTLDADDEFLYLLYGEEQISKVPMAGSGNVVYCTGIRIQESDQICSIENIGALIALSVFVSPSGCTQTVRWSSSDPTVAEVTSDGTVKVVGEGTAIITAKCGSYSSSINVSVKNLNVKVNIAKAAGWFNSNGIPGFGENAARAYAYVGSTAPVSANAGYIYGIPLEQGIEYTIRLNTELAGGCYYGVQIFSSVSKTRIVDSGWRTSGTEFNYTPAEDGLYLYVNFKYGAAGSATITDEILEKLRAGFSIRRNK